MIVRPFGAANIRPYVRTAEQERALVAAAAACVMDGAPERCTFRECTAEQAKDLCPEMIVVPAGSFSMGSPTAEKGRSAVEGPQHNVTIAQPFAVSKYQLTFDEWGTCAAYGDCDPRVSDSGFGRGNRPVIYVTWDDAERYVAWLSRMTGKTYRLLYEAEYEYATRAGTQTAYPWGNDIKLDGKAMANCNGCGSQWDNRQTAPVGSFDPNKFGLYDMVGNVFEWVEDCAHGNYNGAPTDTSAWIEGGDCSVRVVRGGSWINSPELLRAAIRGWGSTDLRLSGLGFRVARTLLAP
jgi:formylglycine-generating enzyme required for sulfatase activity